MTVNVIDFLGNIFSCVYSSGVKQIYYYDISSIGFISLFRPFQYVQNVYLGKSF